MSIESVLRDKADDLGAFDLNGKKFCFARNRIVRCCHPCYFIVHEIHRHLDQSARV